MSLAAAEAAELTLERPSGLWSDARFRLRRNPGMLVGSALLLVFLAIAVLAPVIAPYGPEDRVAPENSTPPGPTSEYPFGLDEQGRDYLSRVIYGTRLSLLVGLVSVAVGLALGLVIGALAGSFGGWVDTVLMRTMDIMLSIPSLLLAIGLITLLGRGLVQIMIAIGVIQVPVFARLLRSSILAVRESDHVLAARSVGVGRMRMLLVHLLPNAIAPLIVQATLATATAIIEVAGLSFLGLGPQDPGLPEWGRMLADSASRLQTAVHLVVFPGFAVVLSVLGINLVGDALREALDPRLRS